MSSENEEILVSDDEETENLSSDEEMETETVDETQLNELEQKIESNPLDYQNHITLISALRKSGELDKLRLARQRMRKYFPLAPNLWLDWIKDELNLESNSDEIENLFKSAVSDYTSVQLWIEYVQWACGLGDIEKTREIFENALVAVGVHVGQGCLIWDAYREFEMALLGFYDPEISGSAGSAEKFLKQKDRITKLFRRQLSLPLIGLENVYQELEEFLNGQPVETSIETTYRGALKVLDLLRPYEEALTGSGSPPSYESYQKYLDFEIGQKNPNRIQILFERAILDHCLNVDLWVRYTDWLDKDLKIGIVTLDVYRRAAANCPWAEVIWRGYLLALERNASPSDKIELIFKQAIEGGYSNVQEAADLWLTKCYQIRRKLSIEKSQNFNQLRSAFELGAKFLLEKFGESEWDSDFSYRKNWARMEASLIRDAQAFRRIWDEIMSEGNGRFAGVWLEYLQIERQYGDVDHSRKILYKAVNSASDFPEYIFASFLQFEKEEGTLEDYDKACLRIEHQRLRINERKPKTNPSPRKEIRPKKNFAENSDRNFRENKDRKRKFVENSQKNTKPESNSGFNGFDSKGTDGFALPNVPPPSKRSKAMPDSAPHVAPSTSKPGPSTARSIHDTSRYDRTVFVSNLDFKLPEDQLRDLFSQVGSVAEVRLVMLRPNLSKGYGYVEFEECACISEALKLDRHLFDGRPMYVSKCVEKSSGVGSLTSQIGSAFEKPSADGESTFRFNVGMEKNKLFVKNVPREATEASLEEIFKPFGNLVSVRLVVHKSGMSKGLAYVEFADEITAAKALLKTDGTFLLGRRLSVAVSNPPARRGPTDFGRPFENSSSKSTSSIMMPRSLTSKPKLGSETIVKASGDEQSAPKPKSNDEFRKMMMKN